VVFNWIYCMGILKRDFHNGVIINVSPNGDFNGDYKWGF